MRSPVKITNCTDERPTFGWLHTLHKYNQIIFHRPIGRGRVYLYSRKESQAINIAVVFDRKQNVFGNKIEKNSTRYRQQTTKNRIPIFHEQFANERHFMFCVVRSPECNALRVYCIVAKRWLHRAIDWTLHARVHSGSGNIYAFRFIISCECSFFTFGEKGLSIAKLTIDREQFGGKWQRLWNAGTLRTGSYKTTYFVYIVLDNLMLSSEMLRGIGSNCRSNLIGDLLDYCILYIQYILFVYTY